MCEAASSSIRRLAGRRFFFFSAGILSVGFCVLHFAWVDINPVGTNELVVAGLMSLEWPLNSPRRDPFDLSDCPGNAHLFSSHQLPGVFGSFDQGRAFLFWLEACDASHEIREASLVKRFISHGWSGEKASSLFRKLSEKLSSSTWLFLDVRSSQLDDSELLGSSDAGETFLRYLIDFSVWHVSMSD